MYRLVTVCLLIVAGLLLGPIVLEHSGYVLFAIGRYTIEMSFVVFVVVMATIVVATLLLLRVKKLSSDAVTHSGQWFTQRKTKRANGNVVRYIASHFITHYQNDNNAPLPSLDGVSETSEVGRLISAASLAQNNQHQDALTLLDMPCDDSIMQQASKAMALAIATKQHDWDKATQFIENLPKKHPFQHQVVESELQTLIQTQGLEVAYKKLEQSAPLFSSKQQQYWQYELMEKHLSNIASVSGGNDMITHWDGLKRHYRNNIQARAAYVNVLITLGLHNNASEVIIETKGKQSLHGFSTQIEQLKPTTPNTIKALLEKGLKQQPNDISLQHTYALFCARNGETELALLTLKNLADQTPTDDILNLLAELYEAQGDTVLALQTRKKASGAAIILST